MAWVVTAIGVSMGFEAAATIAFIADHERLPFAEYGVSIPMGFTAPLGDLIPYSGVAIPVQDPDGEIDARPPLRCPSDGGRAGESGWSYTYVPSAFLPIEDARQVLAMFRSARSSPVFIDGGPFHASAQEIRRARDVSGVPLELGRHGVWLDGRAEALLRSPRRSP